MMHSTALAPTGSGRYGCSAPSTRLRLHPTLWSEPSLPNQPLSSHSTDRSATDTFGVCLSVCMCGCLSVCLCVWLSVCLSVCQCVCVCLCGCVYACVFVWLCVFLSACLSVCLYNYSSVWLSICRTVWLSICLTVWLSVCLYGCVRLYGYVSDWLCV